MAPAYSPKAMAARDDGSRKPGRHGQTHPDEKAEGGMINVGRDKVCSPPDLGIIDPSSSIAQGAAKSAHPAQNPQHEYGKRESRLATWKPRVVRYADPDHDPPMTMMVAEKRLTGLFSSQAPWITALSCSINVSSASRPVPGQTSLPPAPPRRGFAIRTSPCAPRFLPESAG